MHYATTSSTGSTSKEVELKQQLALQKALVNAQWLESFNMFSELQSVKAELTSLKQSTLLQPMPTQQSLHASKAASTSSPRLDPSGPLPGTFNDIPIEPEYENQPTPTLSKAYYSQEDQRTTKV